MLSCVLVHTTQQIHEHVSYTHCCTFSWFSHRNSATYQGIIDKKKGGEQIFFYWHFILGMRERDSFACYTLIMAHMQVTRAKFMSELNNFSYSA